MPHFMRGQDKKQRERKLQPVFEMLGTREKQVDRSENFLNVSSGQGKQGIKSFRPRLWIETGKNILNDSERRQEAGDRDGAKRQQQQPDMFRPGQRGRAHGFAAAEKLIR